MATVNYLDKTDLHEAVSTFKLDPAAQNAVIAQLISDGLYDSATPDDGKSVWVESDLLDNVVQAPLFGSDGVYQVPGFVQVLEVQQEFSTVQTDSALKIIIDDAVHSDDTLNVVGGANPVFVALGSSGTAVTLSDLGNDTVLSSSGNDSITGNIGADLLIGGSGNDTLTDLLSGGHSTLVAGTGTDTLTGVQGDQFLLPSGTMVASGNNTYNVYEGLGNSSINLGTGADTVNFLKDTGFTGASGNDTITNGGAGTDTVNFTGATNNSLLDIKPGAAGITVGTGAQSGDYTVNFTNGQSVELVGHGVASTQTAFTLEFKEGTLNLKGGS